MEREKEGVEEEKGTKQLLSSELLLLSLIHPVTASPNHPREQSQEHPTPKTTASALKLSSKEFGRHIQIIVSNIICACMSLCVYVCML